MLPTRRTNILRPSTASFTNRGPGIEVKQIFGKHFTIKTAKHSNANCHPTLATPAQSSTSRMLLSMLVLVHGNGGCTCSRNNFALRCKYFPWGLPEEIMSESCRDRMHLICFLPEQQNWCFFSTWYFNRCSATRPGHWKQRHGQQGQAKPLVVLRNFPFLITAETSSANSSNKTESTTTRPLSSNHPSFRSASMSSSRSSTSSCSLARAPFDWTSMISSSDAESWTATAPWQARLILPCPPCLQSTPPSALAGFFNPAASRFSNEARLGPLKTWSRHSSGFPGLHTRKKTQLETSIPISMASAKVSPFNL